MTCNSSSTPRGILSLPTELLHHILGYLYEDSWYLQLRQSNANLFDPALIAILSNKSNIRYKTSCAVPKVTLVPLLICKVMYEAAWSVIIARFRGIVNVFDLEPLQMLHRQCHGVASHIQRLCVPDDRGLWSELSLVDDSLPSLQTVEIFQTDSFLLVCLDDAPINYDISAVDDAGRVHGQMMKGDFDEYLVSRAMAYVGFAGTDNLRKRGIEIISHQVFCYILHGATLPQLLCAKDLDVAFLVGESGYLQVVARRWTSSLDPDKRVLCHLTWNAEQEAYSGNAPARLQLEALHEGVE